MLNTTPLFEDDPPEYDGCFKHFAFVIVLGLIVFWSIVISAGMIVYHAFK